MSTSPVPAQEEAMESIDTQETIENTNEPCKVEDGEDEWEVLNETLVYADCVGAVESELMEAGKSVLLVDLDAENPLIQVSQYIVVLIKYFPSLPTIDWSSDLSRHLRGMPGNESDL